MTGKRLKAKHSLLTLCGGETSQKSRQTERKRRTRAGRKTRITKAGRREKMKKDRETVTEG